MSLKTLPDWMLNDIYALTPAMLLEAGIRLMVLDVDNTMAAYTDNAANPRLLAWAKSFQMAGIRLYILSNNHGRRPALFAGALGCAFIRSAGKPRPDGLLEILRLCEVKPEAAVMVGDQIRADVLCARRCGVRSVLVRPIRMRNPFLALRYAMEGPWRAAYKKREQA